MSRICFETTDLTRVRLAPTLGSKVEAIFALEHLDAGRNSRPARWRDGARAVPGQQMAAISELVATLRPVPDLVRLLTCPEDGRRSPELPRWPASANMTQRRAHRIVNAYRDTAIAPHWPEIRNHLQIDFDARSRLLASGGVDRLMSTLDSRLTWRSGHLEIPDDDSGIYRLAGRGLLLVSSVFLSKRPAVLLGAYAGSPHPPVLVVSAPVEPGRAGIPWGPGALNGQQLSALIGRTRAALLNAIQDGTCGTNTALADRLGISSAGVSQHSDVLRQAGLITKRRNRNTVWHTLTPLGAALLCSDGLSAARSSSVADDRPAESGPDGRAGQHGGQEQRGGHRALPEWVCRGGQDRILGVCT